MTTEQERRVSTLELFFDLVFVFTLTQLTVLLADDLTAATAARVALVFVVLFWMYGGYAYLTNQVAPDRPARRILLIAGMGAFLVCALAIPQVFDGAGVLFGVGYLAVVLVHAALYVQSHGRNVLWYAVPNTVGALLVIGAGFADRLLADALWLLVVALQLAVPLLGGRTRTRSDDRPSLKDQLAGLHPGHFVERHGLLLIITFGESVIAIGIGLEGLPLDGALVAGALLALALAAALWWTYFVRDEHAAEQAFHASSPARRWRLALTAYYYAFVPMLLGIAVLAVGIKKALGHLTEHLDPGAALALGGGVALFLLGDVAFRAAMNLRPLGYRLGAVPVAVAATLLGVYVSALAELVALLVVVVVMLAIESWRAPASAPAPSSAPLPEGT